MIFETERLILRPWRESDAESLYEYAKDDRVGPIAGWQVHTSVENSRDIIRDVLSAEETYAVCLKEDDIAIGSIGLIPPAQSHTKAEVDEIEVGYWIGVPFWGQGLIPEAVRCIQKYAFENLGYHVMWCGYYDGNENSKRCQEKCGFIYHHTEENKPCVLMGDVRTEHFTKLTKEEWKRIVKEKSMIEKELFKGWEETLIWSCLQGVMGEVYTNAPNNDAAMAMLGDFVFFAGNPSEKLLKYKPASCKQDFIIMVPQNDEWSALIEQVYKEKAKKVTRYAFKKKPDIFDKDKLERVVEQLPDDFEIKLIEENEFSMCLGNDWSRDLVSQFEDYETYKKLGLGVVIMHNGELVAGASSYGRYEDGIEIEIDTRQDYRRKGLAYVCGAKLIMECLDRNLYPSWDAQNKWSVSLAEKLGYHLSHEYTAYEITDY